MFESGLRSGARTGVYAGLLTLRENRYRAITASILLLMAFAAVSCSNNESDAIPTLRPTRTVDATATPIAAEVAKQRVSEIFAAQVDAAKRDDWRTVFEYCSPQFRESRDVSRFIEDAPAQFARDGYTNAGFEARNVQPTLRAPDRVRVRWEAYENGSFVRTEEVGQTYVFTHGDWYDDGAWCR